MLNKKLIVHAFGISRLLIRENYYHLWKQKIHFTSISRFYSGLKLNCVAENFDSHKSNHQIYSYPTIYALSTGNGTAAIAIVRVSGHLCKQIYKLICPGQRLLKPRQASVRSLHFPTGTKAVVDPSALVLYFPSGKSYTGDDLIEYHIHGGIATVKALLGAIQACESSIRSIYAGDTQIPRAVEQRLIRPAEPGEFTRLAFEKSRLSLCDVERLHAILSAKTEKSLTAALRVGLKESTKNLERWRNTIISSMGHMEALIDFSEDHELGLAAASVLIESRLRIRQVLHEIENAIQSAIREELWRDGIKVAILGKPNVGKSSLLNRIVGREASIVSIEEGTTRDVIEVNVDLNGWHVKFGDTAGLRGQFLPEKTQTLENDISLGKIEQEGIKRAKALARGSDITIILFSIETVQSNGQQKLDVIIDHDMVKFTRALLREKSPNRVVIGINKIDKLDCHAHLGKHDPLLHKEIKRNVAQMIPEYKNANVAFISCERPNENSISEVIDEVMSKIEKMATVSERNDDNCETPMSLGVTTRQKVLLEECGSHLNRFLCCIDGIGLTSASAVLDKEELATLNAEIVIIVEHLRYAVQCLGKILGRDCTGEVVEEVLGEVFSRYVKKCDRIKGK